MSIVLKFAKRSILVPLILSFFVFNLAHSEELPTQHITIGNFTSAYIKPSQHITEGERSTREKNSTVHEFGGGSPSKMIPGRHITAGPLTSGHLPARLHVPEGEDQSRALYELVGYHVPEGVNISTVVPSITHYTGGPKNSTYSRTGRRTHITEGEFISEYFHTEANRKGYVHVPRGAAVTRGVPRILHIQNGPNSTEAYINSYHWPEGHPKASAYTGRPVGNGGIVHLTTEPYVSSYVANDHHLKEGSNASSYNDEYLIHISTGPAATVLVDRSVHQSTGESSTSIKNGAMHIPSGQSHFSKVTEHIATGPRATEAAWRPGFPYTGGEAGDNTHVTIGEDATNYTAKEGHKSSGENQSAYGPGWLHISKGPYVSKGVKRKYHIVTGPRQTEMLPPWMLEADRQPVIHLTSGPAATAYVPVGAESHVQVGAEFSAHNDTSDHVHISYHRSMSTMQPPEKHQPTGPQSSKRIAF